MSVRDLLPWRNVVPLTQARIVPPSDLLRESEQRQAVAEARAYGIPGCTVHSETAAWPDPHGPDPVVFGPWPRVRRLSQGMLTC